MVNTELIGLYWRIGRLLVERRAVEGWGTAVVARLAADLRAEFPGMRGFSPRNLAYMRSLAQAYPDEVLQQPAARLPWGHLMLLLDKGEDPPTRDWYVNQAVTYGWSRAVLGHHLAAQRHRRVGAAPNSFAAAVEPLDSDLARELATDPSDLDLLALEPGYSEHDLEDALIARLTPFLAEHGRSSRPGVSWCSSTRRRRSGACAGDRYRWGAASRRFCGSSTRSRWLPPIRWRPQRTGCSARTSSSGGWSPT